MNFRAFSSAIVLLAGSMSAACAPARQATQHTAPPPPAPAERGLALAQAHCAGCHGVSANAGSPNPESPPFDDIANRPGLTDETFAAFLADAHNYPAAMDFRVDPEAIGDLAAYMVSLRRADYRPTR